MAVNAQQSLPSRGDSWWRRMGPWFGLLLVVATFAAALITHDVLEHRTKEGGSLVAALQGSDYPGFKAFVRVSNVKTVLAQTVIVAVGALGMTLIIVSGGIDLSVGAAVALTSVLAATWLAWGWPPTLVVALVIVAGGLIGVVNGTLIAGCRMMPFIVTLGMMGVCRGGAKWVAGNQVVNAPPESPLNELMAMTELDRWLPMPAGVWVAAALAALLAQVLHWTVFGRYVFAIGSSEATATYSGIRVARQKVWIYGLAGLFFGCAGLMQMTRLSQGDPSGAVGLELDIIAAVVIGGASLSGGTGSILGSMVGALTIQVLRNGSSLMLWPTYMQEIIIGVVIILAVGLDRWRRS